MKNRYENFPNHLLIEYIDLNKIGFNELAWRAPKILDVIEYLYNNNYYILGGDVYTINKNKIEFSYCGWHTNSGDSRIDSKIKALNYIKKLIKIDNNFYFSPTFVAAQDLENINP
jgi:hypothetical protein